ncbi:MAG: lytic transglycosylase domain-containing protein [Pseudomonadota bacterium]
MTDFARRAAFAFAALLTVFASVMPTNASLSHLCDRAASVAARESGVPAEVLFALTRTETGRGRDGRLEPWPWTVNMEGEGRWFDSRDEAVAYIERHRRKGARSFDVGCFQINHRWHGDAFASLEEMFDPLVNARYAARFLGELRDELNARSGDWLRIAGAYHSRTPQFAEAYRARFAAIFDALDGTSGRVSRGAPNALHRYAAPIFDAGGGSLAQPSLRAKEDGAGRAGAVGLAFGRGARTLLRAPRGPLTDLRNRGG